MVPRTGTLCQLDDRSPVVGEAQRARAQTELRARRQAGRDRPGVRPFGLAKAMEPVGAMSPGVSQAPTITTPAMTPCYWLLLARGVPPYVL
jgi:hypothetical protein